MNSTKKTARIAGLLYLLVSIPGIFGLLYVPSKLIVRGDLATTAHNILASETLFRAGIVADLAGHAGFILVALLLYRLLKSVNKTVAALMVIWLVVQIPIVVAAEVHHLAVLKVLSGAGLEIFSEAQRQAQMEMSLESYRNGMLVDEIFMGLWLFPLGVLIIRSSLLPRILGGFLLIAGSAYLAESLAWLVIPAYADPVSTIAEPLRALELAIPIWLLIMGAKDQPLSD
jgi:uncharacterized protein DUF4386